MNIASDWPLNRLLLALPPSNLERLMPDLQRIDCQREQVLIDADGSLDHVYFPDSGVISVVAVYANGDIIEMATSFSRKACTYENIKPLNEDVDSMARWNATRGILAALPGIWTRNLTEDALAPKIACRPVQPSRPMVAISMMSPFA